VILITGATCANVRYNKGEVAVRRVGGLILASLAFGAPALAGLLPGPSAGMAWKWTGERRYYVENELITPIVQMFYSERNYDIRVIGWQTRLVLRCASTHASGSRFDVDCVIDDVSLSAAAIGQDAALKVRGDDTKTQLGVIVEEMDAKLTGATVQLQMKKNGRIIDVDLEGVTKSLLRTSVIQETLRQILGRAVAGFDVALPPHGNASSGQWAQRGSMLLAMPTQRGNSGGSETIHRVRAVDGDRVAFETQGKGVLSPDANDANLFDTRLAGSTVFDVADGSIVQRDWTVLGKATAGSALADGFAKSPPYGQRGWLQRLAPGETAPAIPPSREVTAPGYSLSTLQGWTPLPEVAPELRGVGP
jgi:hypothetical protein